MPVQIITMSTKGQIVLPSEFRENLGLSAGSKLAAYSKDGFIILKPLIMPTENDFKAELSKAQILAKQAGLTEEEVKEVIEEVRKRQVLGDQLESFFGILPEDATIGKDPDERG